MAFKMKGWSPFTTHEGSDKPHKQSKLSKLVEKGVEGITKIGLGPIWGGTKWMIGKEEKPNIVKLRDLVKSKLSKKKKQDQ